MHHPLEYKVISYNKDTYGKVIYVGTKKQCLDRILEIAGYTPKYAKNLKIEKY